MKEIVYEIIKDLQIGIYHAGKKQGKVKKSQVWGQIFKKMDKALEQLIKDGKIVKIHGCEDVSFKLK